MGAVTNLVEHEILINHLAARVGISIHSDVWCFDTAVNTIHTATYTSAGSRIGLVTSCVSLTDTLRKSPMVLSLAELRRDKRRGVEMKLPFREPEAELSAEPGSLRLE